MPEVSDLTLSVSMNRVVAEPSANCAEKMLQNRFCDIREKNTLPSSNGSWIAKGGGAAEGGAGDWGEVVTR